MSRGEMRIKAFVVAAFFVILLPTINTLVFQKDAGPLVGVSNEYEHPEISFSGLLDGTYQEEYEVFYSHSFSGYRLATRLLNEIKFRLFGKVDNIVRCKDGSVIFENYIEEYLGISKTHYCTPEYLDKLASQIKRLSDLAKSNGKQLMILITPNKAEFIQEEIPDKYFWMVPEYPENQRGSRQLAARLKDEGVMYVDGATLLSSQEWSFPVFPETGIHWTREAGIQVLEAMTDCIEKDSGKTLKRISVSGRELQDTPRRGSMNNDDDLWQLMNIISKKRTEYSYPVETEIVPENCIQPEIFVQGGSFSWTIIELLYDHDIAKDLNFLYYDVALYGYDNTRNAISGFWDEAIKTSVQKSDLIILEVNEEAVYNMGSGFYPILEEILSER